jgi:hypothetical protein
MQIYLPTYPTYLCAGVIEAAIVAQRRPAVVLVVTLHERHFGADEELQPAHEAASIGQHVILHQAQPVPDIYAGDEGELSLLNVAG